jgi:hypothetical protein
MGKRDEFANMFKQVTAAYEKNGAKLVGFWWTLAGEGNEAVCINAWKNLENFEKGNEAAWKDKSFPLEKVASTVITTTDKILKPVDFSPLK